MGYKYVRHIEWIDRCCKRERDKICETWSRTIGWQWDQVGRVGGRGEEEVEDNEVEQLGFARGKGCLFKGHDQSRGKGHPGKS